MYNTSETQANQYTIMDKMLMLRILFEMTCTPSDDNEVVIYSSSNTKKKPTPLRKQVLIQHNQNKVSRGNKQSFSRRQ